MSVTRIMGFDPSTYSVGWAYLGIQNGEYVEQHGGTLRAPQKFAVSKRLADLYDAIVSAIAGYEPDVIAVETPFVGRNPKTTIALAQGMAMVLLAAEQHDPPITLALYSPSEIKASVTGNGAASKRMVAEGVATILGVGLGTFSSDNESDALAIAICHHHEMEHKDVLRRVHQI